MNCQNCGKAWTITQAGWLVCEGENFCSRKCANDYGAICIS